MTELQTRFKDSLRNFARGIEEHKVALFLSGGIDCRNILFALLEEGKEVHCYNYHMDNIESTDYKMSKKLCEIYGLEFTDIPIPSDVESIKSYTLKIIKEYGADHKADIECIYPIYHSIPKIEESVIISGVDGGFFLDSKKAVLHYSETLELSNEYRMKGYNNHTQRDIIDRLIKDINPNLRMLRPYYDEGVFSVLLEIPYSEINKPNFKGFFKGLYPEEMEKMEKTYFANYQKGDSGIGDSFNQLMDTEWGDRFKGKTVVSVYNAIVRGEIPRSKKFVFGL